MKWFLLIYLLKFRKYSVVRINRNEYTHEASMDGSTLTRQGKSAADACRNLWMANKIGYKK